MAVLGGYQGKILRVNLSTRRWESQGVDMSLARGYLGGDGFGARLLFDGLPTGADALDPANLLILMTGPVQGTIVPLAGRAAVITKSPLTDGYMDSYFGGHFGSELKYAGWDGIVIEGAAEDPVYLLVQDDLVQIRDAKHLWGKDTYAAQEEIRRELGDPNVATVCIGPAGEGLARIACVISGVRAAGRGGTGAVMGSKKLKAVAVRGSRPVRVPDMDAFMQLARDLFAKVRAHPGTGKSLPQFGTPGAIMVQNRLGMLGTNNWKTEVFANAENISGEVLREQFRVKDDACSACPVSCGKVTRVSKGPYKGFLTVGPDYETLWALGSNCGNADLASIIAADRLCDAYGLDTISTGAAISFAMECFEEGIIGREETDGIDLSFGNSSAVVEMVHRIARREGLGRLLGEGVRRAAAEFGGEAHRFAIHVKGLEVPAHSARGVPGMAVGYATSVRGGTHQDGRPTAERIGVVDINQFDGKGAYEVDIQRMTTVQDSMILCRMAESPYGLTEVTETYAQIVRSVTGLDVSREELILIADRIYTLQRLFNILHRNESRKTDALPERFTREPIPEGPAKGKYMPQEVLERLLDEYYAKRGWDRDNGYPTKETLAQLGLAAEAERLFA